MGSTHDEEDKEATNVSLFEAPCREAQVTSQLACEMLVISFTSRLASSLLILR